LADLSPRDKVSAIFDFMLQNYQWNGTFALYPDVDAAMLQESKSGNGTAMNLMFIKLLRASGFEAHPVMMPTTAYGSVQKNYPDLSQFNHVIASVRLYGKDQLIDVSDAFSPYTLLPLYDINGEGYLIDLEDSRWLVLSTNMKKKRFNNLEMTFGEDLKQRIKLRSQYNDYAASMMRKELAESERQDIFASTCLPENSDKLVLDSIMYSDLDLLDKPLKINAVYDGEEVFGDTIAFTPVMMPVFRENPFQAESRVLPVDFIVPIEDSYTMVINVPEGFEIGFIPAPYELSLPGNKGSFSYQVTVSEDRIKIKSVVMLEEVFYDTGEYEELRMFFGKYCDKIKERVVFQRMR
jgi:hypothetical protein